MKLKKLRPSFKESGGSVTAGNASSMRLSVCVCARAHARVCLSTSHIGGVSFLTMHNGLCFSLGK